MLGRHGLLLLASCFLVNCTRTSETKSASTTSELQTEKLDAEQQKVEVVQRGNETITTTVEEFAEPQKAAEAVRPEPDAPAGKSVNAPEAHPTAEELIVTQAPILVKRTTVVDQISPITDTTTQKAKEDLSATQNTQTTQNTDQITKTRAGPSVALWLGIGGGLGLAISIVALILWLKAKKAAAAAKAVAAVVA